MQKLCTSSNIFSKTILKFSLKNISFNKNRSPGLDPITKKIENN